LFALLALVLLAVPASAAIGDDGAPTTVPVLTPHTFTVQLTPSGDPDGSGTAELTVDLKTGTGLIYVPTEPVAGIENAHIHSHAKTARSPSTSPHSSPLSPAP
jgi:predicted S18 family serine protease